MEVKVFRASLQPRLRGRFGVPTKPGASGAAAAGRIATCLNQQAVEFS